MKRSIYLDHNATTPVDPLVLDAMRPWLEDKHGNASSIHAWGVEARLAVERARRAVARAIHAKPEEIVFTSGGTEANNLAIRGIAIQAFREGRRLRLLTSTADHSAVLDTVRDVGSLFDCPVTELPVSKEGRVERRTLESGLSDETTLLATLSANNEIGTLNDIHSWGEAEEGKANLLRHVDAVQSLGKVPVDVGLWKCDTAAFAAHKLYGPKGVGALFVRTGTRLSPLVTGGGQEGRVRAGTENVAGIVGFGAAVSLAMERLEGESARLNALREELWAAIHEQIPTCVRNTPTDGGALPGTLNVSLMGMDGRAVVRMLDERGIGISAASACSSGGSTVSHVLRAITDDEARQRGAIRISMGASTGREEARSLVSALAEVAGGAG